MAGDRTIFDEPHHRSLEVLAARALAGGDVAAAFRLADRRCRIAPAPEAHSYILRGEARRLAGDKAGAESDLLRALELAPDDIAANRRMLAWTEERPLRSRAAKALIGCDRDLGVLRKALQVLRDDGQKVFAHVAVLDDTIEGWAVWHDAAPLEVAVSGGGGCATKLFEPDPRHPLGEGGHAVGFALDRPRSAAPQSIALSIAGRVFHSVRAAGIERAADARPERLSPVAAPERRVTVIVPVYGDHDATRACLGSLVDALLNAPYHRALIVDDATPDPRIATYLAALATEGHIELLVNQRNLGFIGAVNRALAHVPEGDIILLNADTIVPSGFIDRLAAAAYSSPDIGTVTPLSNNGEFTSFPLPNVANPLGSRADVERIDRLAATVERDRVVDIPSGIGFCLYVTRTCLDAVGCLSEEFHRGYLEDVDFCLRARAQGLRNVCAPAIYVGHAGSKSFGLEKRALVMRNLAILERRFPTHRPECAAFMLADPLRRAREAIERIAAPSRRGPRFLLAGAGTMGAVALERAGQLAGEGRSAIIFEVRPAVGGHAVRIFDPAGGMPQSVRFDLGSSEACDRLAAYARGLQPSRIEILDPINVPIPLMNALRTLKVPYDMFIADAGLLDRGEEPCVAMLKRSVASVTLGEMREGGEEGVSPARQEAQRVAAWRAIAKEAGRILVPCEQARAFAARLLPAEKVRRIAPGRRKQGRSIPGPRAGRTGHLGILPVRSCAQERRLIFEIVRGLGDVRPDVSVTIIGATLDDLSLMRLGNVFVTGRIDAAEYDQAVQAYRPGALFVGLSRPLFGHPVLSFAGNSDLPTAYVDWSMGEARERETDLPIDPRSPLDAVVASLARWIPRS